MQVDTGRPPPFLLALPHFLHGFLVYLCHGTSSAVLGLVGLHLLLTTMQITRCVQKLPFFEDSLWGSLTTTYGRASDFCISQLGFLSPTPPSLSSQYLKIGKNMVCFDGFESFFWYTPVPRPLHVFGQLAASATPLLLFNHHNTPFLAASSCSSGVR